MNEMAAETIRISTLTQASETTLVEINSLLAQLSSHLPMLTLPQLEAVISTKATTVYTATDTTRGTIVGMASVVTVRQLAGTKCWIEDVVVSRDYQGQGIGQRLLKTAIASAPPEAHSIELTSNPHRQAARHLYEKMGFTICDSTLFSLKINSQ